MEQRISQITLGVSDVGRARRFYEALGWKASDASTEGMVYFVAGGPVLCLFGRPALARNAGVEDPGSGFAGITLTYHVRRQEEIYRIIGKVKAAGGKVLKAPEKVPWGGYAAWFADPDGHAWEVTWSPTVQLDAHGHLRLA